jgi:hypothetical protein
LNKIDLHIVSFDVPYPPTYGGVVDVFYRLEALSKLGVKIALHCFQYGREESKVLSGLAEQVYYYKREKRLKDLFSSTPFIVKSRENKSLLKNLMKDSSPILFEGVHCSIFSNHPELEGRLKWIRMHNVESHYYSFLAKQANSWFKKLYYLQEAKKLKKYEINIKGISGIFCLSQSDCNYFSQYYKGVKYLAVFFEGLTVKTESLGTREKFALYHGNLDVEENIKAVEFLKEVFSTLDWKLIVAGNSTTNRVKKILKNASNMELIASPSKEKMNSLIKAAHLHCLPTFQDTGVKLKLISSLLNGRILLVNRSMITENHLEKFCELAEDVSDWRRKVSSLMESIMQEKELKERKDFLLEIYDNEKNAKLLLESLAEVR